MSFTKYAERWVLVDCNSFYCSCERLFRPWLKSSPLAVLSNNDGCLISLTREAKALGLKMGSPYHECKEIIRKHDIKIFSSNYPLYGEISRRIMQTLCELYPEVIQYSIDEAFVNISHLPPGLELEAGEELRKIILQTTGIPVSVGIGKSKVLAKIASLHAKKDPRGVSVLCELAVIDDALQKTPVDEVWGIGRRSAKKLQLLKIQTALDFKYYGNIPLIRSLLTVTGERIKEELHGINCVDLNELGNKKNITSTRSFGKTIYDRRELEEAVATYVGFACEKLRGQDSVARVIGVMLRSGPAHNPIHFYDQVVMAKASSDTTEFTAQGIFLIKKLYRSGISYKKAGVFLSEITSKFELQLEFFSHEREEKNELMRILDEINGRWGRGTIRTLATGTSQDWRMLSQFRSRHTQLNWDDLMEVKKRSQKL